MSVRQCAAFIILMASVAVSADAAEIFLQPDDSEGKDTFMTSNTGELGFRSEHNHGAKDGFILERQGNLPQVSANLLIEFDVPMLLPGESVESARLGLTLKDVGPASADIEVYRMIQPWVEGTRSPTGSVPDPADGATWQTYDGVNPWPGISGFGASDGGGFSADSAEIDSLFGAATVFRDELNVIDLDPLLVEEWMNGSFDNNGLLVVAVPGTGSVQGWTSGAATAELRPFLEITTVIEQPTLTADPFEPPMGPPEPLPAVSALTRPAVKFVETVRA